VLRMRAEPSRARRRIGILHAADAGGVEAGERFVEKNDRGAWSRPQQWRVSASCRATAPRAADPADPRFPVSARSVCGASREIRHSVETGHEYEVLPDGEVFKEAGFVGEKGELALGLDGIAREIDPGDPHRAARGG